MLGKECDLVGWVDRRWLKNDERAEGFVGLTELGKNRNLALGNVLRERQMGKSWKNSESSDARARGLSVLIVLIVLEPVEDFYVRDIRECWEVQWFNGLKVEKLSAVAIEMP
ncbi:hypothetical protein B0H13DRAFT_2304276 [Mycena leptocephala]|nr:hypothetical protein B0H13DRAFT_2304276 [Mycena leptocephala]